MARAPSSEAEDDTNAQGSSLFSTQPGGSTRGINLQSRDNFTIASWNLQGGLKTWVDFQCVAKDLEKRKVDIACLQETNCHKGETANCEGGTLNCLAEPCEP